MQDHSFHSCFTEKKHFLNWIENKTLQSCLNLQDTLRTTEGVSQENEKIDGPGAESALLLFQ